MTTFRFKLSSSCSNIEFLKFDISDPTKGDWEKAVGVFRDRFEGRYFNPIKQLMRIEEIVETEGDGDENYYPGFITLSMDFILLETLNQFKHGINDTTSLFHNKCAYAKILRTTNKLAPYFKTDEDAIRFYDDLRCGLIHQGQTKGNSKLNKSKDFIVDLYKTGGNGFNVNRTAFHEVVLEEYQDYSDTLLNLNDRGSDDLRVKFREKMYYLCGDGTVPKKAKKCSVCSRQL